MVFRFSLILFCLAGCAEPTLTSGFDCEGQSENISLFILKCIENANPKSDEEPEDWIGKCQSMARTTYCKPVAAFRWRSGMFETPPRSTYKTYLCKDAKFPKEKTICQ